MLSAYSRSQQFFFFFFQAEDGIRDYKVTGVQTCALPILTSVLGTAAVLFIGVRHVVAGVLTVGQLWMALRYLDKLYEPLKTISKKAAGIQSYLASAERAFALLDEQPEDRKSTRLNSSHLVISYAVFC